jgi:hypothetical protein
MQRLKPTGTHRLSPSLPLAKLASALHRLGVSHAFSDEEVGELYGKIALINGGWMAKEESKEGPQTAKTLFAIARSKNIASAALAGHETGFHTTGEIQATSLIAQNLASEASSGGSPTELITKFQKNSRRIADAALAARHKLREKSDRNGREQLIWYDRFTQLLLDIAKKADVEPTLGNDPINDVPCGWLFEAATELEAFLYRNTRSGGAAGRASRLRRSLKRLGQPQGHNFSSTR